MSATQKHIEKAIGQIQHKEPVPEIDFTQHQLENGFTISTQERVVKEVRNVSDDAKDSLDLYAASLGPSTRHDAAHRRPIFLARRSD